MPVSGENESGRNAADQALPDAWYYRLGGREHGPFLLRELMDLVGSSGDTALEVEVRQTSNGPWVPFRMLGGGPRTASGSRCQTPGRLGSSPRSLDAMAWPIQDRRDKPAGSSSVAPSDQSSGSRESSNAAWRLRDNLDIVAGVAVCLVINAALLYGWSQSRSTEQRYVGILRQLDADVKELRLRNASDREWNELRLRVTKTLEPIVKDLKKTANASDPVRQHLLWAARDQFPKLLGPSTEGTKEAERVYRKHMDFVERDLGQY
jgi:hypothetical protein